jgi:hypothetical protein
VVVARIRAFSIVGDVRMLISFSEIGRASEFRSLQRCLTNLGRLSGCFRIVLDWNGPDDAMCEWFLARP